VNHDRPRLARFPEVSSFLGACRPLGKLVIGALEAEPICRDLGRPRAEIQREIEALVGDFLVRALKP
jgi:hypothetical protein